MKANAGMAEELLAGNTPLRATVALKGGGFIGQIKKRNDVQLIEVDDRNRDELVDRLVGRLRELAAE